MIGTGSSLTLGLTRQVASMINALVARSARLAAGTSMAASALPLQCATHGIRFCARKPPRLPSVVIAAMAAAAWAPLKICDGRYQKQGNISEMHGVPTTKAA